MTDDMKVRIIVQKQPGGRGPLRWHYAVDVCVDPNDDMWVGFGGWTRTKREARSEAKMLAETLPEWTEKHLG